MGKTSLVLDVAMNAARSGHSVGMFSLEMPSKQLFFRMVGSLASLDSQKIRNPRSMTTLDWKEYDYRATELAGLPIYFDDTASLNELEFRSRARRFSHRNKLDLLIIDYVQLMTNSRARGDDVQDIGKISMAINALKKELDIPIIVLSQLSRAVESRPNKRPMMQDLRQSGQIEQDADTITFIYRDEYYDQHSEDKSVAELIIAKQRNGPIGTVKVQFDGRFIRFRNLAKGENYGLPEVSSYSHTSVN